MTATLPSNPRAQISRTFQFAASAAHPSTLTSAPHAACTPRTAVRGPVTWVPQHRYRYLVAQAGDAAGNFERATFRPNTSRSPAHPFVYVRNTPLLAPANERPVHSR